MNVFNGCNCTFCDVLSITTIFFILITTINMVFYHKALKERLLLKREIYDDLAKGSVVMAIITLMYIMTTPFTRNTVIDEVVAVVVGGLGLAWIIWWANKLWKTEKDNEAFYRILEIREDDLVE